MDERIAHKDEAGRVQTVKEHSFHVANFCREMGKRFGIGNLCYIVGLLHDMGKIGNKYQEYIWMENKEQQRALRGTINHSAAGAQFLVREYGEDKAREPIRILVVQAIAGAIVQHHGLKDLVNLEQEDGLKKSCFPKVDIEYDVVKQYIEEEILMDAALDKLLKKADEELSSFIKKIGVLVRKDRESPLLKENKEYSFRIYTTYLEKLILSILVDADYTDAYEFMDGTYKRKWLTQEELGKIWQEDIECLEQYLLQEKFQKQDSISKLRREISKECLEFSSHGTGIYKLPCPTGAGKTIASLRFAFSHAKKYQKERIFYIAPYRSILEQTAEEIRKILKEEGQLLEFHSNVIPDNALEYQFLCENWENLIIATTFERLGETLFSHKMQAVRRFYHLTNAVLIIDEVQNIPVKMIHLFNTIMNFLCYECNTTIILCTATQPLLEKVQCKIHLSQPCNMIKNLEERYLAFQRVHIYKGNGILSFTSEQAGEFLYEKTKNYQSILMIVNTKKTAETIYRFVKERLRDSASEETPIIYYLTGNMCPQHRMDVLDEIRGTLGEKKLICIATNLIEAGIDVSFECVIRSIAGLDHLIQAGGRCNRHGEKEYGDVFLIDINDENLGRLEDVKKGKQVLKYRVDNKKEGECLDELLSVKAVEWYYEHYFFKRQGEMNDKIEVDGRKTSIVSLLGGGHISNGIDKNLFCVAAFKTAGEKFELIDSKSIDIVVPYKKGRDYIAILNGKNMDKKKEVLPLLQRYTVNIYEDQYKTLEAEGAIYAIEFGNIMILDEAYYDEVVGVTENAKLDFLFL